MYKFTKLNFKVLFSVIMTLFVLCGNSAQSAREAWVKPVEGTVANPFGNGYVFYGYYRAGHTGIDIKADVGTPVEAVRDGVIRYIQNKPNMRYGYYIVIEHDNGLHSLYGHLQKIFVTLNKKVKQGDIIATSGISGFASYPHLHFEITDKIPVRDGAWGYDYICKMRRENNLNGEEIRNEMTQQKFNFLNVYQKQVNYFYRMKKNHCIEEPISPITYYNPELFLPHYERSSLPNFNHLFHPRKRVKDPQIKIGQLIR